MNPSNFLAELKRRNVYKVAVAYLVAAWLLIQIATQVFPFFDIPNWAVRLVVVILILGFPIALVLSWAFEITPEGIKREENVVPDDSITHKTGRKIVRVTIALAVIAAGLFAFQFLRPRITKTAATTLPAPIASVVRSPVDQKSLAVLAFANLSDDKNNESFADSVSEELLNVLGKVAGLKVTARTSAFHFKGKDTPIPEIARQLGVAYVVEGSVRHAGDKVRITAQLIKAADGFHVWSDTFTRDMKDVFAVQDEIAGLIAQSLELKLGVRKDRPAPNPEAYQLYLEGVRLWGMRNPASLDRAEQLLRRALALQPDFARAAAAMGLVNSIRASQSGEDPTADARALNEQALKWAERALALDPDLAEGYAAKGNALDNLGRWSESKETYRRSCELDPNFATAHQWYARSLSQEGYMDEAMVEMKRAVELDPLAPRILDNYATYLVAAGKFDEALQTLDRALEIQPGSTQAQFFKVWALLRAGRPDEARALYESLGLRVEQRDWNAATVAELLVATGRRAEAEALLQRVPEDNLYLRGVLLCILGRGEEAVPLLQPVVSIQRDFILWGSQEVMPRKSAEFHRKLAEWGMTESWRRAEAWRAKNLPKKPPVATAP